MKAASRPDLANHRKDVSAARGKPVSVQAVGHRIADGFNIHTIGLILVIVGIVGQQRVSVSVRTPKISVAWRRRVR